MVAIDDIGLAVEPVPGAERLASAEWSAWGVTARVTVTDPAALAPARRLVAKGIAATEAAANRHRRTAEIHRLYRAGGRDILISPLLAELVAAALVTAERTGGDVDPTINAVRTALSAVPSATGLPPGPFPVCEHRTTPRPVPGWQLVRLNGRRLQVPAGVTLDLTATAKAVAVDRAAARVADRLGCGVLVQLGSDVASAGPAPQDGWRVAVRDRDEQLQAVVVLPAGAALSTAHLTSRTTDRTAGVHLIDPHTGRPPAPVHQQATVLAFSCLEAAAYAAAALVRGTPARFWLTQLWVPARLVTVDGDVVTAGPWAAHETPLVPGPRLANPRRTTH